MNVTNEDRASCCPTCGRPVQESEIHALKAIITDLRLTPTERRFVETLANHPFGLRRERLHHKVYADRWDGGPDPKIIDVLLCKIRKHLAVDGRLAIVSDGYGHPLRLVRVDASEVAA